MSIQLKQLNKFMFSKINLEKYISHFSLNDDEIKHLPILSSTQKKPIQKSNLFTIHEQDELFWCFYIIHYGYIKYEQIFNKFIEEKKIKIEMVGKIRENKHILKQNKWKKNIIESELINENKITVNTLICLLTVFNYNFAIKNNNLFYSKINTDDNNIFLIIFDNNEISLYDGKDKQKKITEYQNSLWNIENYDKPLKAISNYKVKDLQDIAKKLNIDMEKKRKKDLYMLITENIDKYK